MPRNDDFEAIGHNAALGNVGWSMAGDRLTALVDGATLTLTAQYSPEVSLDMIDMRGVTPKEVELYVTHFVNDDLWRNAAIGRRIVDRSSLAGTGEWGLSSVSDGRTSDLRERGRPGFHLRLCHTLSSV
jgi:hypothetical protein